MKTTTKILIYALAGILFLTVVYIAGLSTCLKKETGYSVNNQSCMERHVPECAYLRIDSVGLKRLGLLTGTLNISTSPNTTKNGIFIFPTELEKYIRFAKEKDTLVIRFVGIEDFLKEKKAYAAMHASFYYYPKDLLGIKNCTVLQLFFRDFRTDNPLNIQAEHAFVELADSCNIAHLVVDEAISLKLRNARIDALSLDLDAVKDLKIENCTIPQENLFGFGKHRVDVPSGTSTINWFPRTKEANLSVTLSGTPARIECKE